MYTVYVHRICTLYMYTVYGRMFGGFPAKNTVCTPYIYGSGQPYQKTYQSVRHVLDGGHMERHHHAIHRQWLKLKNPHRHALCLTHHAQQSYRSVRHVFYGGDLERHHHAIHRQRLKLKNPHRHALCLTHHAQQTYRNVRHVFNGGDMERHHHTINRQQLKLKNQAQARIMFDTSCTAVLPECETRF